MQKLILRNLTRHPLRTLLTLASLAVALFLFCTLRSLVTTLSDGIAAASSRRIVVQSAVSLFVELPMAYQAKLDTIDGVRRVSKQHWFGAYFQDEANQFSQFAVDPQFFDVYPEFEIVRGSRTDYEANVRGCVIGEGLVERFGWDLGDKVPLIGMIYPHPDGPDVAWEFEVEAIYRPAVRNFDSNGMLFHWEYFERTMEGGFAPPGVGTYVVEAEPGAESTDIMAAIDATYANGPQRVQATSEAEFQAQFISMFGNVPTFLTLIGGAVLAAILMGCVNAMLMSAREQTHDIGILKALGFGAGHVFRLLFLQALVLCLLGGGLGVLLAKVAEPGIREGMAAFWPGYRVAGSTVLQGAAVALVLGLISGVVPAWRVQGLRCIDALGARE